MSKKTNDALRQMYVGNLMEILAGMGEDPIRVNGSEIAIPVVDGDGEDNYVVFKVQVPTGSRDGDPYDPYALAQEYWMKKEQREARAKEDAEKKARKIARDQKAREERAAAKAARAAQN